MCECEIMYISTQVIIIITKANKENYIKECSKKQIDMNMCKQKSNIYLVLIKV